MKRFARRRNRVDEFAQVFALPNSERRALRSNPERARRRRFGRFVGRGVVEKRIEKNAPVERVGVVERGVEPIVERHNEHNENDKAKRVKQSDAETKIAQTLKILKTVERIASNDRRKKTSGGVGRTP